MKTVFKKFENIRYILGDRTVPDELVMCMSQDNLLDFVEHLEDMYDIN